MNEASRKVKRPRPRPKPYRGSILAFLAVVILCAPGCASFGHNVWNNRQEVFARLDNLVVRADEVYGGPLGYPVGLFIEGVNAALFLTFAGFSGAAHALQAATFVETIGLAAPCEGCETRPSK